MEHRVNRIRAASLVIQNDRLLLIKSVDPHTGDICWVPLEEGWSEMSLFSTAPCERHSRKPGSPLSWTG